MIFAGGLILIVRYSGYGSVDDGSETDDRVRKFGCKIRDMGKVGCLGYGKRLEMVGYHCICIARKRSIYNVINVNIDVLYFSFGYLAVALGWGTNR
jgi:hypothetical protein